MIVRHLLLLLCPLLATSSTVHALCVLCNCTVSTTPVAFGVYNPIGGTSASGVGNVMVSCSGTVGLFVDYNISLGRGSYATTYDERKLANGSSRLSYQLYGESSGGVPCSAVWGDGSGGSSIVGGSLLIVLLGSTINRQVCGVLPANQNGAISGFYSDSVQVIVTYY